MGYAVCAVWCMVCIVCCTLFKLGSVLCLFNVGWVILFIDIVVYCIWWDVCFSLLLVVTAYLVVTIIVVSIGFWISVWCTLCVMYCTVCAV